MYTETQRHAATQHIAQPSAARLTRSVPVQVHGGGLRHIRADRRVNEWRAPGRRTITKAATNERQAVIVLSGGELLYFELDAAGQLQVRQKASSQEPGSTYRPLSLCEPTPTLITSGCTQWLPRL